MEKKITKIQEKNMKRETISKLRLVQLTPKREYSEAAD